MGLFSTSSDTANKEVDSLLMPDEQIEKRFKLVEDYITITNKRLILVDAELGSSKREIISIPFKWISEVAILRVATSFSNQIAFQVGQQRRKVTLSDKSETVEAYKLLTQKIV